MFHKLENYIPIRSHRANCRWDKVYLVLSCEGFTLPCTSGSSSAHQPCASPASASSPRPLLTCAACLDTVEWTGLLVLERHVLKLCSLSTFTFKTCLVILSGTIVFSNFEKIFIHVVTQKVLRSRFLYSGLFVWVETVKLKVGGNIRDCHGSASHTPDNLSEDPSWVTWAFSNKVILPVLFCSWPWYLFPCLHPATQTREEGGWAASFTHSWLCAIAVNYLKMFYFGHTTCLYFSPSCPRKFDL